MEKEPLTRGNAGSVTHARGDTGSIAHARGDTGSGNHAPHLVGMQIRPVVAKTLRNLSVPRSDMWEKSPLCLCRLLKNETFVQ